MGQVISTVLSFFLRATRSRKVEAADEETEQSSPGKEQSFYSNIDSIDALSSSLQHNARSYLQTFKEEDLSITESHEASNIPISGSCNSTLVLDSSILINLVDDEDDRRRSCVLEEIKDVVSEAHEASSIPIPTSGSCNSTLVLGSSILINLVDDEDDMRGSCVLEEIKDAVVSEEALPREADGLGEVGLVIGKEDFIERPVPLVCEIRRKGPYTSSQKILLVGEGDFSFSACLAVAFSSVTNMVATSLDSWEFLCKHYERAMRNSLELTNRGGAVMHEIDATEMARKYSPLQAIQFDIITFNFPHTGVFMNDAPREVSFRNYQKLISMFLANVKMMIKMDGEIHIWHKSNGFFREWKIQKLEENEGLRPIEAVPFHRREHEGYSTKFCFGDEETEQRSPGKEQSYNVDIDCIDSWSSSLLHNAHRYLRPFKEEDLSITESHEASNIPTSGSCNSTLVLGSSILINLVDDEDDSRGSCALEQIKDVSEAHEASNIPTSGSCNSTLVLGSSRLINLVDDEDDIRGSCVLEEIKDVVVSKEALPREADGLGEVGLVIGKEYFIERPVPLPREADNGLGEVGIVIDKEDFIERPWPLALVCERELGDIRRKGPYTSSQKILLVGEGDFSFSACLAVAFSSAINMVATSLDSKEFLYKNYQRAMQNILELTNRGCAVMHEIDATKIARKYSPLHGMQFDRIIFNFPHAGVFKNDGPRAISLWIHQELISKFLANAKMMMKMDGEIHIRHKSNGFFREWNIQRLGENEGLQLIEAVPFHLKEYEGYGTKLGYGGDGCFNCNPSKTYKFGLPC